MMIASSLLEDLLAGDRQFRPAQLEMATLIEAAISREAATGERQVVLVEAGTGSGKSYGYLTPILRSGKTTVVSTANKALQEQIFKHDVPFLQKHLRPFEAIRLKGMNNYLCRVRFVEALQDPFELDTVMQKLEALMHQEDFDGDLETVPFPLLNRVRQKINGNHDVCTGKACEAFDACYIQKVKEHKVADVIIVNHTLLLIDALMGGCLLPPHEVLVIDEAHNLQQVATGVFTTTLRPTHLSSLLSLRTVQDYVPQPLQEEVSDLGTRFWVRIEAFPLAPATSTFVFPETVQEGIVLAKKLVDLKDALRLSRPGGQEESEAAAYEKVVNRVQNLADKIRLVSSVEQSRVHYIERREALLQVCAVPLDVAPFLQEKLFATMPVTVLTSATLATLSGRGTTPFSYFRKQIGIEEASLAQIGLKQEAVIERILPLVFDYPRNALLYIPRNLPEPPYGSALLAQYYAEALAGEMERLLRVSHGRAFLLFSSRRMLEEMYQRLHRVLPFPCLRQSDDINRTELLRQFCQQPGSILFGLKSFWEGVDIAGEALSLVIIDKLPFSPPSDPVAAARVQRMKDAGEDWFGELVLPDVVTQLKQGIGRLLRKPDDRGAIVLLDTRLLTKGYGARVISALPPARRTSQFEDVQRFFEAC